MLKTRGVSVLNYKKNKDGVRFGLSPFLHYPDYCPHWPAKDREGDCMQECHETEEDERLCYRSVKGLTRDKKEEVIVIKWAKPDPKPEEKKPDGPVILLAAPKTPPPVAVDQWALDALSAIIGQARDMTEAMKTSKDHRGLVRAMETLRDRMAEGS